MSELDNLSPGVWGHSGWKFLFAIASVYSTESASPQVRQRYYTYFSSLAHVLPCSKCRHHYQEYLDNKPIAFYLENRHSLFHWLLGLHNKSNPDKMLVSKEAAIEYYLNNNKYGSNAKQQQQQQQQKMGLPQQQQKSAMGPRMR